MITRSFLVSVALGLAACGQTSAPAIESDSSSAGDELPPAADLLANEPLAGAWETIGDGATTAVRFTPQQYPDTLTIGCNGGSGRAFMNWTVGAPAEDGDLRLYTAAETVTFAATGTNDGVHVFGVDVDGADPRLDVLKVEQERFAVQGFGQVVIVPWDASIAIVLNECAV